MQTAVVPAAHSDLATQVGAAVTAQTVAVSKFTNVAGDFFTNAAISLLILVVTLWLATWASRLAKAAFHRLPKGHQDETLGGFVSSLVRYIVVMIGGIAVLNRVGFQTTSIITVLGAASLAIGLALQGALSNVAAGVMVLMMRPYRVGDFVTVAGKSGTVKKLDLFNTELVDPDGLKIVAPNGKCFGDVMINYTDIPRRRIQLQFGIDYDDSIEQAIDEVMSVACGDERVLKQPAPWCMVTELAASQVTVELRAWSSVQDYWTTRFDLTRKVKEAFDAAGITIPFPTQATVIRTERPPQPPLEHKARRGPDSASDPRAPEGDAPPAKPPEPD